MMTDSSAMDDIDGVAAFAGADAAVAAAGGVAVADVVANCYLN